MVPFYRAESSGNRASQAGFLRHGLPSYRVGPECRDAARGSVSDQHAPPVKTAQSRANRSTSAQT